MDLDRLARQAADLARQAAGGDGDMPGADVDPTRMVQQAHRADHRLVVRQRLAHPHEDDVAHAGAAEHLLHLHHLFHDLSGGEITHQSLPAGGAEGAPEGASDLARYAHGIAPGVGDEHGLDHLIVRGGECELRRAVGGALPACRG